jgi:hypothetical protein
MRVKSSIALLCLFSTSCFSQSDSATVSLRKWYVPRGMVVQYAGGTGMLSAGLIWSLGKRTEVAVTAGYTPRKFGNIGTVNLYGSYTFLNYSVLPNVKMELLRTGAFVNYNYGDNIYLKWPEQYPDLYYWWNSAVRFGPFIDNAITFIPRGSKLNYGLFFHCNTNDLYFAVYRHSHSVIHFTDILVFGTGLRITVK